MIRCEAEPCDVNTISAIISHTANESQPSSQRDKSLLLLSRTLFDSLPLKDRCFCAGLCSEFVNVHLFSDVCLIAERGNKTESAMKSMECELQQTREQAEMMLWPTAPVSNEGLSPGRILGGKHVHLLLQLPKCPSFIMGAAPEFWRWHSGTLHANDDLYPQPRAAPVPLAQQISGK